MITFDKSVSACNKYNTGRLVQYGAYISLVLI